MLCLTSRVEEQTDRKLDSILRHSMTKPIKWVVHPAKTYVSLGIYRKDSDQPGHLPSLVALCGQRRLGSAQADLSSLGAHVIFLVLSCSGSNKKVLSTSMSCLSNFTPAPRKVPGHKPSFLMNLYTKFEDCCELWTLPWWMLRMMFIDKWATSCANNKGADQPAHSRSLISTFVLRCLDSIIPLVSISQISSL